MSDESQILDRVNGRLTGPTGEAEFLRCAADDIEWCLREIRNARAERDDAQATSEELAGEAEAAAEQIRELEHRCENLRTELTRAEDRIAQLEGPEAAE